MMSVPPFIFTSNCLWEGSCLVCVICVCLKSFSPMIADQEKINGCVRFAFQLSPFLKPGCQKYTFIFMLICFIGIFCNDKAICNIFIVFKH